MSEIPPPVPLPPPETPAASAISAYSVPQPVPYMSPGKPGKVQAIAILTLICGCMNAVGALVWLALSVLYVPFFGLGCVMMVVPVFLGITAGMEIMYATRILPTPMKTNRPNKTVAILQICCALSCNALVMVTGILALVFYGDPEVKAYFEAQAPG